MEENKTLETPETVETPEVTETPETTENEKTPPTIEELMAERERLMVELAKTRRQSDRNAADAKGWKEKLRATQSEKDIMDAEKAEAQAKKDEEFEDMKKRLEINDLTENFMDIGYSKDLAKKAATAQVEGDTDSLLIIQKQFQEAQKKAWEADFLKSRPEIQVGGTTSTITKEQFEQMSLIERTKLKRENPAEYDRLVAL